MESIETPCATTGAAPIELSANLHIVSPAARISTKPANKLTSRPGHSWSCGALTELCSERQYLDFVNRSQVVTALAPARQIGVQLTGWIKPEAVSLAIGAFNGNGIARNNNDNGHLLYAARLTFLPAFSDERSHLEIGVNAALSEDDNVTLTGLVSNFNGSRRLFGGDLQWKHRKILLSGEAIYSRLNLDAGETRNAHGLHATAGYMVSSNSQALFRWDMLEPGLQPDSQFIILGYNLWPTRATEVQVNYLIDTDDSALKHHGLLMNAQVAF